MSCTKHCKGCGQEVEPLQKISQSESNPSRAFYQCSTGGCSKFLGWVDGNNQFEKKRKVSSSSTDPPIQYHDDELHELKQITERIYAMVKMLADHQASVLSPPPPSK